MKQNNQTKKMTKIFSTKWTKSAFLNLLYSKYILRTKKIVSELTNFWFLSIHLEYFSPSCCACPIPFSNFLLLHQILYSTKYYIKMKDKTFDLRKGRLMKLLPNQECTIFLKLSNLDFTNITLGFFQPFNIRWYRKDKAESCRFV